MSVLRKKVAIYLGMTEKGMQTGSSAAETGVQAQIWAQRHFVVKQRTADCVSPIWQQQQGENML